VVSDRPSAPEILDPTVRRAPGAVGKTAVDVAATAGAIYDRRSERIQATVALIRFPMSVFTNPATSSKEQASAYTNAILGLLGDAEPSAVLRRTPADLQAEIADLTDQQLSTPEAPGKWSIRHVVRHLADSEIVFAWRVRMILAHEQPPLTGYDQDRWADRLGYDKAELRESLEEFTVLRRGHLRLLDQASPQDLARYGVHAERGNESVAHLMRMYAGHDTLHLKQIARIRAALGA
jgi:hypothetical protein